MRRHCQSEKREATGTDYGKQWDGISATIKGLKSRDRAPRRNHNAFAKPHGTAPINDLSFSTEARTVKANGLEALRVRGYFWDR